MIHLVTFTDERMTISAQKLVESAGKHGVDQTKIYSPDQLPEWFINHHKELLKQERGYGFYCWKPFIVSEAINKMQDGDFLIYADAGQTLVNSARTVTDAMNGDIMLFSNGWPHVEWCKGDALKAILNWDVTSQVGGKEAISQRDYLRLYREFPQVQASLIFFRVSRKSREFCKEWLSWSLMPGLIDNEPSILPNYPTFAEHRWDQALIACLQIKYSIALHWFPSTTAHHIKAEYPNDHYPEITLHHRKRNNEW